LRAHRGIVAGLAVVLFAASPLVWAQDTTVSHESARPFDPDLDREVLALVPEAERDALEAALADAGKNWPELADAIGHLSGDRRADCVRLVGGMPHLDRLEMKAETLIEHVEYAYRTRTDMPYEIPSDMFEPYILTYRIGEEPVDAWRRELFDRFSSLADSARGAVATARALNREVAGLVTERDREFFGPTQSPLLTLRSGRGTAAEISILTCAALKALGIPSREVGVRALGEEEGSASWVEVYAEGEWLPLYPLEPGAFGDVSHTEREHWRNVTVASTRSAFESLLVTERYTDTGVIELSFVAGGRPASGFEHFSIAVLNKGSLVPLDALDAIADDEGRFTATLGNGRYVVQAGFRDGDGYPFVMMRDVTLTPGSVRRIAFDVTPDGRGETIDREQLERFEGAVSVWIAFDLGEEPSRRMLPLIAAALGRTPGLVEARYVHMGDDQEGTDEARSILGPDAEVWTIDGPEERYYLDDEGARVPIGEGGAELPVVRVYARHEGRRILHSEGYDLNIERSIATAVDAYIGELLNR
jgi:hypothetical protein